ncbi:hypothetical protein CYMTET_6777 [Cymbomonas tetramitiformis]|uniref:Cyclic nucleotide-binding domain-containing protein n=1 Tax=Cymbomonas tetramitiformis TaxID=36881 RepID=A0AAE0GWS3_9CHLO|nr:hypothetical protein CYMTET_6777 [Cymbomonas tetramitiformis]
MHQEGQSSSDRKYIMKESPVPERMNTKTTLPGLDAPPKNWEQQAQVVRGKKEKPKGGGRRMSALRGATMSAHVARGSLVLPNVDDGPQKPLRAWPRLNKVRELNVLEKQLMAMEAESEPELEADELERVMQGFGLVHQSSLADSEDESPSELEFLSCAQLTIIHPENPYKDKWDIMIILLVLYTSFIIPLALAFETESMLFVTLLDTFVDVCFALDMVLSFITGYYDGYGVEVLDPVLIRRNYLVTWFWVDFFATFPFELILLLPGMPTIESSIDIFVVLKLPRLLRIGRLMKKMDTLAAASMFRIVKLLGMFLLVAHWVGSGWFMLGELQKTNDRWTVVQGLKCPDGDAALPEDENGDVLLLCKDASLYEQYTASLYWAMTTMTTVGYGDITPGTVLERLWTCCVYLVGAILYSTIFANVAMILQGMEANTVRYKTMMDSINELLRFHTVPDQLADVVRKTANFNWDLSGGINIHQVLLSIPLDLRLDVSMHMYESMVRSVPLFRNLERSFIQEVVLRLHPQATLPGQFIFCEGDVGMDIWLIGKGTLYVTSSDGKIAYKKITKGQIFGENILFYGDRRLGTVRSATHCHCFSITKQEFMQLVTEFPQQLEPLLEVVLQQYVSERKTERSQRATLRKLSPKKPLVTKEDSEIAAPKRRVTRPQKRPTQLLLNYASCHTLSGGDKDSAFVSAKHLDLYSENAKPTVGAHANTANSLIPGDTETASQQERICDHPLGGGDPLIQVAYTPTQPSSPAPAFKLEQQAILVNSVQALMEKMEQLEAGVSQQLEKFSTNMDTKLFRLTSQV